MLLYDSSKNFFKNNHASYTFELTSLVFVETGVTTVEFAYMDVNNGTIPEKLKNNRIFPHMQFLPAGAKDNTPYKTELLEDIQGVLLFVKENAKTDISKGFEPLRDIFTELFTGDDQVASEEQVQIEEEIKKEDL